jgi:hypothetical protein
MIPYISSGRWLRLGLPPTIGGIVYYSSPMGRFVSIDVVDKTLTLGQALFAAIYSWAYLIIGVSGLSLTMDIILTRVYPRVVRTLQV